METLGFHVALRERTRLLFTACGIAGAPFAAIAIDEKAAAHRLFRAEAREAGREDS